MSAVNESPGPAAGSVLDNRLGRTVADLLRGKIASRELPPGSRLIPAEIAADLGVSRGPVREAIAELVAQGLVVQSPRRAAYVRGLSAADITQLSLLRGVLEGLAARLACERLSASDDESGLQALEATLADMRVAGDANDLDAVTRLDNAFHDQLARMADFPTLEQILSALAGRIRPLIAQANVASDVGSVWQQHEPFLAALRDRDAPRLERYASDHASAAGRRINTREAELEATARAATVPGSRRKA